MNDKDVLELLNMYTTAAQVAKAQNEYEFHFEINEVTLAELLKKAFPHINSNDSAISLAREILNQ